MSANRRNFLITLSALPLAVPGRQTEASVSAPPPARRLLLNRFPIAGSQYYAGPAPAHQNLHRVPRPLGLPSSVLNLPKGPPRPQPAKEAHCFKNAGLLYFQRAEEFARLGSRGAGVRGLRPDYRPGLKAEPDNPYVPFAVSIYLGRTMLGYVPRSDNKHISHLLEHGAKIDCRVIEIDPEAGVWNMVRVEVCMVQGNLC